MIQKKVECSLNTNFVCACVIYWDDNGLRYTGIMRYTFVLLCTLKGMNVNMLGTNINFLKRYCPSYRYCTRISESVCCLPKKGLRWVWYQRIFPVVVRRPENGLWSCFFSSHYANNVGFVSLFFHFFFSFAWIFACVSSLLGCWFTLFFLLYSNGDQVLWFFLIVGCIPPLHPVNSFSCRWVF